MAPKEPDWAFLETIDPEDLDDEKADQVKYYYECLSLNFYVWIKRQRLDVKEETIIMLGNATKLSLKKSWLFLYIVLLCFAPTTFCSNHCFVY